MPAIIDQAPTDGGGPLALFESGAILLYLADKTLRFVTQDPRGRNVALQRLFWQMGGWGPMAGQKHHFTRYAPVQLPYAVERHVKETARLCAVPNEHLGEKAELGHDCIAGDHPIADMACDPWVVPHERQRQRLADFPHLARWFERIRSRPATERTCARALAIINAPVVDEAAKRVLFGQDAATVR